MRLFEATLLLSAFLQGVLPSSGSFPRDLQKKLFSDYNAKVIPNTGPGERVPLKLSMHPIYIHDLDEEKGILSLDSWIWMIWNDSQLTWNPASNGGVDSLIIPSSEVWKPDISLYNASPSKKLVPPVLTNVIVNHTGQILWVPPFTINSRCNLQYTDYPEDVHECVVKLGSWTFGSLSIDIQMRSDEVSMGDFDDSNPTWSLEKAAVRKLDKYYDCCPNEYYTTLDYTLTLKRKESSTSYIVHAISIYAVFLALMMFWLPPNSTHKIILGALAVIILMLEFLFLGAVLESPGARLRCIGRLYPFTCLVGVLLVLETIVINLSAMSSAHRAPKWLVSTARGACQPLRLCVSRLSPAVAQKTEEDDAAEGEWKLVAMFFDRVFFSVALVIVVLFHKVL